MSITGAADGPPFRLGVAIADIVTGMFAAHGIAMALLARERTGTRAGRRHRDARRDGRRCSPTRPAIYFATGTAPARHGQPSSDASCRTKRSPRRTAISCSRSATTISGGGSARSPALARGRAVRHQPAARHRLRRAAADRRRSAADASRAQHWIDALTAAGVPCGSVRDLRRAVRRSAAGRARDDRDGRARDDRAAAACSACRSSCRTRPARCARAPPTLGQHTDAVLRARSRIQRRRDRRAARGSRSSDRHGNLRRPQAACTETIERAKQHGRRAPRRAPTQAARDYERVPAKVAVPLFRQVANALKAEGYAVHGVHAGGQRAPDVGPSRGRLHRADARHHRRRRRASSAHVSRTPRPPRHRRRARRSARPDPTLTEEQLLDFLLKELEPFVER